MIRHDLENWLTSIFELPVVRFVDQIKSERVIYYSLAGGPIETRKHDHGMSFMYECVIIIREPKDSDLIGWISKKFSDTDKRIDCFSIELDYSAEVIESEEIGGSVISKSVRITQDVMNDCIQERINSMDLTMRACE